MADQATAYTVTMQNAVTTTGAGTLINVGGMGALVCQLEGWGTATVTFQALADDGGGNWNSVQALNLGTGLWGTTASANGLYLVPCAGLSQVRANVTAYTSGTLTVVGKTVPQAPVTGAGGVNIVAVNNVAVGNNLPVQGATTTVSLSATSPNSATTAAQTPVTGLGPYRSMTVYAVLTGATGGTLDVYLQGSPDGGTTWMDIAHYTQIAAAASAVTKIFSVSKAGQQTTITTIGSGTSPALAANTVVGGDWGDRLRVVFVGGAGTTAGAAQTILATLTT